jgi:hypothetical protein
MATVEKTSPEVEECRFLLDGSAKNLVDRLYGPRGLPWGTSFSHLERTAVQLASAVRKRFLHLALTRQSDAFLNDPPEPLCRCPSCQRDTVTADPEPRILHCRAGAAEWIEPQRYCRHCRKAYFPQSKSLGIDLGHYSTQALDLITYSGANKPSFREASLDLDKMANLLVHEKQVERLCKRIGGERLAERNEEVARFLALPLVERLDGVPQGVTPPAAEQVAVVMADAGMLQLRSTEEQDAAPTPAPDEETPASNAASGCAATLPQDELRPSADEDDPDQEKAPPGRHWHEDKVGLILTMRSPVCQADPCPEIPPTFIDPERVTTIVRGLKKSAPLKQEDQSEPSQAEESPEQDEEVAQYEGPKVEERQVVASRLGWPLFGAILACAAYGAGFAKAPRKAFVADGAKSIWGVWKKRFRSYVPILDFIHALSYVYSAAQAVGCDATEGWRLYSEWIGWVWQGKVGRLIEVLKEWLKEHGQPDKGESTSSKRSVVARTVGYLQNNRSKMNYSTYRRRGLPIMSSLVESMVKQISRRVKGTEKFWTDDGAEAILQLRADYLSDGDIMEHFWQRRQDAATGQRFYRPRL